MKTLEKALLGMSVPVWSFFAWLIACEVEIFPESFRGTGTIFHWQIWMLAGIVLIVARSYVDDAARKAGTASASVTWTSPRPSRDLS